MTKISIVGLGYVGLPLAISFGSKVQTIGYDINKNRIQQLKKNYDKNSQVDKQLFNQAKKIKFTSNIDDIFNANFLIITLPTPVDKYKKPDLKNIKSLCKILGKKIKKNTIIVFESTLYPGATRNEFLPIIQKFSELKYKKDYFVGYSPERINVGDKKNSINNITKIISGDCKLSQKKILKTYKIILKNKVYLANSIEVAEAAKVFENTQRDVNISLMNELSMICNKLNLKTSDVINAASTKWNFIKFNPGLVGGHCISVDPYYLSYCANKVGIKTILINAGRKINDNMSNFIAKDIVKYLGKKKKNILVLGLTFKENCSDIRDSKIFDLINKIKGKYKITIHDPYAIKEDVELNYKLKMSSFDNLNEKFDCIIINLLHNYYKNKFNKVKILNLIKKNGILFDLKGLFNENETKYKKLKVFNL